ncbi:MAG TPA: FAD-linked oxidase C-terminal domain-containing protein [Kiloniellales bacterium]|nr:FAD-linked oxidase C-terminal domain-containing protein [Kiloniellales bacterium]
MSVAPSPAETGRASSTVAAPAVPERVRPGDSALAGRLARELEGEVLFDAFSRGRYSTDASLYQVEPIGVVVPRGIADIVRILEIAGDAGVPVLPRGGGTSQCGQTVGEAIVIDVSKHLDRVLEFDAEARTAKVEPGVVLDVFNRFLEPHGLFFPVDVSTSSRATIGGMAGNNSCGARSVRYGMMRRNVRAIDALLADGSAARFGLLESEPRTNGNPRLTAMVEQLLELGRREASEVAARFPKVHRRVGGYNIDALATNEPVNLSHLLVGSEGTLALSTAIELELQPIPRHKVLGVCHFPTFYQAMDSTRHIVGLGPSAVELVDRTMVELARDIPLFRAALERFVKGDPAALLLVEFAGDDQAAQRRALADLDALMASLGFPDAVVEAIDPAFQRSIWDVRKAGLNIMMSMKGDGKPVSFIEDCAVPLEDLAEYTDRLTQVFHKHGTEGTWYAHASEGCLHVRPVLNLKLEADVKKMRAIAEEAFAMVREYKGSHSGEHGDGLVRSEFHEVMFGRRMTEAFETVKAIFDPEGRLNPGKIVRPPRMDDRSLFRYKPDYAARPLETALDWSDWHGFAGAVEMCNNNGACRKRDAAVMCPSFRATGDEQHLTRGRANSLRLALTGQLGPDALASDDMYETMKLCVSCKGCKRECPTGVDMARMKIEFLHHYHARHGMGARERLTAYLPRYAPIAARLPWLMNLRDTIPGLAALSERALGLSAKRSLPRWRVDYFAEQGVAIGPPAGREVVLLADTFNRYFEPENLRAALSVLRAGGYRVHLPGPVGDGRRPLCCGRTFLASGMVEAARAEARRLLDALAPFVARGLPVVGLEPSCLLTLRDELEALLPGEETVALAKQARLFEEFLAAEQAAGRLALPLRPLEQKRALLHGHCHQKAFDAFKPVETVLRLVPELEVETVQGSCCGMAGAFGYAAETYDVSLRMGELSLLPAVRAAAPSTLVVADGTSCRHQIADGAGRKAVHVAVALQDALDPDRQPDAARKTGTAP